MMRELEEGQEKEPTEFTVPLRFRVAPRLPSFFCDQATFNLKPTGEIMLTFFETVPETNFTETQEETFKRIKDEGILAEAQVRVTIPINSFLAFVSAANKIKDGIEQLKEVNKGE